MQRSSKSLAALAAVVIVAGAWVGVATFYFVAKPTLAQWTIAVTAAALVTEAAFWAGALVLGATAFQRRRQVWAAVVGLLRPAPKAP